MKCGKLPSDKLKNMIIGRIKVKRDEVLVHSGIGEDCSIVDFGEHCCVLSSDPITGSGSNIGYLSVHISCNDIAACGVEPLGILVTVLAPESCREQDIYDLMNEVNDAAAEINVEVLGGHTEVTSAVNRMVISTTAIGKGPVESYVTSGGAEDGDFIIVTKYIGLEGTSILANDYEEYLKARVGQEAIKNAKMFINMISVVKEGIIGGRLGATSMHDATEGGLLGALWEVAEASELGFEIYRESIPVKNETLSICSALDIDPLRLISSGSMIITVKNKDTLLDALHNIGVEAMCIGRMVGNKDRRVLISGNAQKQVSPPTNDELFNVKLH